ncbi:MAG: sugar phosphate isomerase/epimerase [Phycisphaerae bacterium]|nr:sugar phosphate isomerase/epimerase [Phycisphaerae bacterium]
MNNDLTRRGFMKQSLALAAAAGLARAEGQATQPTGAGAGSVRLGGPVFNAPQDPEELALAHRKLGYRGAYCPHVDLNDKERIRDIERAFKKHDVVIAEVGRWVNLLDADPAKRAAHLKAVTEGLALADAIGARCCVDIAGSFSTKEWFGPHPDNLSERFFDAAVENARKIIDAVKPRRAKFCYEMMGWALPDSPDAYLKMIKAIDREGFGVHLDPANLVNSPRRLYRNTTLLNRCFDKLGPYITSCHAKDLARKVEMNVHFVEVAPGDGEMDFTTYLQRLAKLPQQPPLMIEHMPDEATYRKAARYLLELGPKVGVRFE